jgi:hypothetical protein
VADPTPLEAALRTVIRDLGDLAKPCALVGGLAVSVRAEVRFTRDVDIAVRVASDAEAEALVHDRGFDRNQDLAAKLAGLLGT